MTGLVLLFALAAQELARNLERIDHLHLGEGTLPMLRDLLTAGTRMLEAKAEER